MGTIVRSSGSIASRGYPALRATRHGMPSANLQSLLWFEDGTLDAAHAGPYTNSVSGGAAPTKHLGGNPTKRSYGLETNSDGHGLVIDTGVALGGSFTIIRCIKSTVSAATTQFIGWWGPSTHSFPGSPSGTFGNGPAPWPTMRVHGEGSNPHGNGQIILDNSSTEIPSGQNPYLPSGAAPADEATVVAFRAIGAVTGSLGLIDLWTLPTALSLPAEFGARTPAQDGIANAALLNYFASGTFAGNTHMVGAWPFSTLRPATAELYAFAVYNAALDADVLYEAMMAMAKRVSDRGVSVFGFN